MIEVAGLSKYYSGKAAIKDVNFTINKGEIVGLLGLNGAGKSTILKILGCFLTPSGGAARVAGFSVDESPDQVRRLIGYLPDSPPLYDEMSVLDYLTFVAKLKRVATSEVDEAVRVAMDKTNLNSVTDKLLGELSHGFRQRVGIAQAIVHRPPVLIFDEPNNGLDPVQIVEMRDLITSLKGQHTVVLSSHILSEITKTCDRVLIVDHGHLVAEGNEAKLSSDMVQQIKVVLTVAAGSPDCLVPLRAVSGVTEVKQKVIGHGDSEITVVMKTDVRAEVAKCVVDHGVKLLSMHREEGGLEGVFMKLIQASHGGQGGALQ